MYYTAVSQYLGFRKFGDEYKVMGLAAYGEPAYLDEFRRIVRTNGGVGFRLGLEYFTHHRTGPDMTWRDAGQDSRARARCFPITWPSAWDPRAIQPLRSKRCIATARLRCRRAWKKCCSKCCARCTPGPSRKLCLAGGVAFNCVANGKIFDETPFEQIFVQPAAGDAGLAVGAAYYVHHQILGQPRTFVMEHAYWGPGYSPEQMRAAVAASRLQDEGMEISELPEEVIAKEAAKEIAAGKILGWFQGRAEWGPRALGNRSIVADPRRAGHEGYSERQDQAPRNVPAVRSFRSWPKPPENISRNPIPPRS